MSTNLKAGLWIIASCFLFTLMNAMAKLLLVGGPLGGLHPLQVTFARYLFAALTLAPFAVHGIRFPIGIVLTRYLVRVVAGYLGVVLMFFAVKELRLSDATAIGFTSPFFAIAVAVLILGERADHQRWIAALIGFIGVVVITRPSAGAFEPAALIALLAAVAMGAEIVGVKWVSEVDKPVIVILLSNLLSVPLATAAALPFWMWPSGLQWGVLIALGVIAAIGQHFVLRGARQGNANFIAPFFYFSLVFATLLGAVLFGEIPPLSTIAGAFIIIGSAVYSSKSTQCSKVAYEQEYRSRRNEKHETGRDHSSCAGHARAAAVGPAHAAAYLCHGWSWGSTESCRSEPCCHRRRSVPHRWSIGYRCSGAPYRRYGRRSNSRCLQEPSFRAS